MEKFSQRLAWTNYGHAAYIGKKISDSKIQGANTGPIWGPQDPGGPHVGPMNFAIWDMGLLYTCSEYGMLGT